MPNIRRTSFGLLIACCFCGLLEAVGLRPAAYWLSSVLFLIGLAGPFGLLIWSFVCLENEKTLTRVALGMVFFFMLALCIVIARLPA
jgi:hypothetical protein